MKRIIGVVVVVVSCFMVMSAWAACKTEITSDFQGSVCTETGRQTRSGKWTSNDSTFEGDIVVTFKGQNYTLTKSGYLQSATFKGNMAYNEEKTAGVSVISENRSGEERTPDGGIFTGQIAFQKDKNNVYRITKSGILVSDTFRGNFTYDEQRKGNTVSSSETRQGRETAADGSVFYGKIIRLRANNMYGVQKEGKLASGGFNGKFFSHEDYDGSVNSSRTILNGTWKVSPSIKLTGQLSIQCTDNKCEVTDTRR